MICYEVGLNSAFIDFVIVVSRGQIRSIFLWRSHKLSRKAMWIQCVVRWLVNCQPRTPLSCSFSPSPSLSCLSRCSGWSSSVAAVYASKPTNRNSSSLPLVKYWACAEFLTAVAAWNVAQFSTGPHHFPSLHLSPPSPDSVSLSRLQKLKTAKEKEAILSTSIRIKLAIGVMSDHFI